MMKQNHWEDRLDRALILGLLLATLLLPLWNFWKECAQIRGEVFRLHILAASDSPEDQANKLAVRDALLAESERLFEGAATLSRAELQAAEKLEEYNISLKNANSAYLAAAFKESGSSSDFPGYRLFIRNNN